MKLGKLSADDIRTLLVLLPRLEMEASECRDILFARQNEFFASDCLPPSWCHLYELPFKEHVTRAVVAFGQEAELQQIAHAPSQIDAMRSVIGEIDSDKSELTADEKEEIRPVLAQVMGVVTSLLRSLQCLMAYGAYLNDLIAVARTGGERGDKAIYKAVRIDPSIIGTPTVLARLSQATLVNDNKFLVAVKKAINGGLSKQAQANARIIRLVLQVLRESGAGRLSNDDLVKLFVEELQLYAATAKMNIGDSAKGIRAIEDRMRKAKATT